MWCDVNAPFKFAEIEGGNILRVRSERRYGRLRPTSQVVFDVAHGTSFVSVPVTPVDIDGAFVMTGTESYVEELTKHAQSTLGLGG